MKTFLLLVVHLHHVRCADFGDESENFYSQNFDMLPFEVTVFDEEKDNFSSQSIDPESEVTLRSTADFFNYQATQSPVFPQQYRFSNPQLYPNVDDSALFLNSFSASQSSTVDNPILTQSSNAELDVVNSDGKFEYASLLRKALEEVDLESMYTSPNFVPESLAEDSVEREIYAFYSPQSGAWRWSSCFKNTIEDWKLFGAHEYTTVDPIIVFGLHRIIETSGFQLPSVLPGKIPKCKATWNSCISNLFKGIGITYSVGSSRNRLFQSLLWFFGMYRSKASKTELEALKLECDAEKSIVLLMTKNSHPPSSINNHQSIQPFPVHYSSHVAVSDITYQTVSANINSTATVSNAINNTGGNQERKKRAPTLQTFSVPKIRLNFKYCEILQEALEVDLPEKFSKFRRNVYSKSHETFEYDIFTAGTRKWSTIFERTLNKWRLFGEHEYEVESLASIGLLRVVKASNFQLRSKALGFGQFEEIMIILREICFHDIVLNNRDEIYQTLLWFFGRYKTVASKEELAAIRLICPAELPFKGTKCFIGNSADSSPTTPHTVPKQNARKRPLNRKSSDNTTISDKSSDENTSNATASIAAIATNVEPNYEASFYQRSFEEVLYDSTSTSYVRSTDSNLTTNSNSEFQGPLLTYTTFRNDHANGTAAHDNSNTSVPIGNTYDQYPGNFELYQQPRHHPAPYYRTDRTPSQHLVPDSYRYSFPAAHTGVKVHNLNAGSSQGIYQPYNSEEFQDISTNSNASFKTALKEASSSLQPYISTANPNYDPQVYPIVHPTYPPNATDTNKILDVPETFSNYSDAYCSGPIQQQSSPRDPFWSPDIYTHHHDHYSQQVYNTDNYYTSPPTQYNTQPESYAQLTFSHNFYSPANAEHYTQNTLNSQDRTWTQEQSIINRPPKKRKLSN